MLRTKIYINGTEVDLLEDVSIPMTFSINDIREPEKKSGAYSKTITIPGSQANNKLFSHIWNVATILNTSGVTTQFNPNFNPNLKAKASVVIDGQEILRGTAQLLNVTLNYGFNYAVDYEICIYADINDLITSIGDKMLSDLDLSEYDHTYSLTNQLLSWSTSIKKNGGTYVNFSGGAPTGEGYVYPMIDYGFSNGASFNVNEFFPAVYAKTIFDKICGDAGFQIAGQFDYSEYFKRLIVPFSGSALRLSDTQIQNRTFKASTNATYNFKHDYNNIGSGSGFPQLGNVPFQDDSTGTNFDPGNVYSTSTYKFTAPNDGLYKFDAVVNFDLTHYPKAASVSYNSLDKLFDFMSVAIRVLPLVGASYGNAVVCDLYQGAGWNTGNVGINNFPIIIGTSSLSSGTTTSNTTIPISLQAQLKTGDIVDVFIGARYNLQPINNCLGAYDAYKVFSQTGGCANNTANFGWTSINIKSGSYFRANLADTKVQEGDTVSMNNVLPNNIKQKDFLLSVIKAHNLYVLSDKVIPNKLIIDDRNSFYSSGTTRYWDTKLDYSKPRRIIPMGELDARDYLFTYKDDSDYFNDKYKKFYNEIYAQARHSVDNDFLKDEVKTELIFSPTPLADYTGGSDRIIPQIYTKDSLGFPQPKTSNIRLLYYNGVMSTSTSWAYVSTSGTTNYNTYAYAGMVDVPTAPTVSLDFDTPHEVYYTTNSYTDNNLFNKYWRQALQEQTDPDSKIFEGYFRLTPQDIAILDFRDQFYFEGQLWRLNKIYDYDPIINDVTKCEFIKLKTYAAYTSQTKTGYGGVGSSFTSGSQMPVNSQRVSQNNNSAGSFGSNNYIASTSQATCRIMGGSNNRISEGCTAVNIISSSGVTVESGLSNITVVNSSGTTVSQSGSVIIGSQRIGTRIIKVTTTYVLTGNETLILADATSPPPAGFNVWLPFNPADGYSVNVKKVDASANPVVIRPSNGTIDGASTYSNSTQWQSNTFEYYQGAWYIID